MFLVLSEQLKESVKLKTLIFIKKVWLKIDENTKIENKIV